MTRYVDGELTYSLSDGKATWYEDGEPIYSSSYGSETGETVVSVELSYSFPDKDTLLVSMNGCCDCFSDKYQRV